MKFDTILVMIIILGCIWGGFYIFMKIAYQKEKESKKKER